MLVQGKFDMKRRNFNYLVSIGIFGWLLSFPVSAAHWNLIERFCPEDFIGFVDIKPDLPIPVGCEVIDCCPGCPAGGSISWHIRLDGDLVDAVTLEFDNLSDEVAKRLELDGVAKRLGVDRIEIGRGRAVVRGFTTDQKHRPPVALPRFSVNEDRLAKYQDTDGTDKGETVMLAIDQMLGPVVVNSFRLGYFVRRCNPPVSFRDQIDLNNNITNDSAWVLVDGRRSTGCRDDEIYRTTDVRGVGNLLTNGVCNSEVFVFSDNDGMAVVSPVTVWTDAVGDTLPVNLAPMLQAPVNVWLALAGSGPQATADVAQANFLYNNNNAGIAFVAAQQNVSGNPAAVAAIGGAANRCSAARLATLQGSAFYVPNQLNVYYINGGFTASNCVADRNVVHVGTAANIASLAHEFGHSFSLFGNATTGAHTNTTAGFGNNNIMWAGGPATRNRFSIGQAFRFNMDANSSLNTNGVRAGPTRTCQALTTSATCPALVLDSAPP
jgi:hypothetical protein